ncbi:MAG: SCP2 sterol-binding domain-containing protein [Thiotrichales bacterium]|nr:SCP2 sterol-binding domain-containing protein [Thiotrichales bacterium]
MTETILEKIETLINRLVLLDSVTLNKLRELAGKRLHIHVSDLDQSVLISVESDGLRLSGVSGDSADVLIRGRLASLAGLLFSNAAVGDVFPREIEIRGDIHLAQDFRNILLQLQIDWEEYASGWIGDTAARKFGNFFRANRNWLKQTGKNIRTDVSEYLRFEIELLPDHLLITEFNNAVDNIRDDVDRLQQRINRLAAGKEGGSR